MKTFDIDRHADELERDGYTILENVLPASEIEATKQAIKQTLASEETVGRRYGLQSENLRMAFNAQAKHPHFRGMPLRYPAPAEVAPPHARRRYVLPQRGHPHAAALGREG